MKDEDQFTESILIRRAHLNKSLVVNNGLCIDLASLDQTNI